MATPTGKAAVQEFNRLVAERKAAGVKNATAAVIKGNPKLHTEYLVATNDPVHEQRIRRVGR